MPHGGVNYVKPTEQAIRSKGPIQQPGGAFNKEHALSGSRPIQTAPIQRTSVVGVATCGSAAPVW